MIQSIIGKKLGMTNLYREGKEIVVTAIEAGPCFVSQVKTEAKDGYNAVQLAFGETKKISAAEMGHLKNLGKFKHLREFAIDSTDKIEVGQKVDADIFKAGDIIDVVGISKGKGFAGGVKRYHFAGGLKTHGQSDRHRAPGAVGATTSPGRVFKGLRMAGHMGSDRVKVQNLQVVDINPERHVILVKGAVPGAKNGLLLINKAA
jgi:large subunit ribosomal protein L3